MQTYQSLRKKSCRISLKIAKLVHMGIPVCIRAGKGFTCGGISMKLHMGIPVRMMKLWAYGEQHIQVLGS